MTEALFLERADEAFGAAVALGSADEGRTGFGAEEAGLALGLPWSWRIWSPTAIFAP
jgi:hypothetical protein